MDHLTLKNPLSCFKDMLIKLKLIISGSIIYVASTSILVWRKWIGFSIQMPPSCINSLLCQGKKQQKQLSVAAVFSREFTNSHTRQDLILTVKHTCPILCWRIFFVFHLVILKCWNMNCVKYENISIWKSQIQGRRC